MKHARVVGAGLSGLATAACLRDAGFQVDVIEAASEPGGLIGTTRTPHGLVERAANAFVWTDTTARWFERLDITPSFPLDTAKRRFIYRDGRPRRWPLRRGETAMMAARLGWSYLTRRHRMRPNDTVAQWIHRIAGRPAVQWFIEPALQGIYGAPADRLSAAAVFGGFRRPRGGSATPPGGMSEFIERLYDDLREGGVSFSFGAKADFIGGHIPTVVCTNARSAAPLVEPHAPKLAAALRQVNMFGLQTVTAFFERSPDDIDGFGVLFPRQCGIGALGVLFNSSIFEGRGPLRAETWIYTLPDDSSTAAAAGRVADDRRTLTGRDDTPRAVFTTTLPDALPVYDSRVAELGAHLETLPPWLSLTGNYLGQIGVSTLLARAESTVSALVARSRR